MVDGPRYEKVGVSVARFLTLLIVGLIFVINNSYGARTRHGVYHSKIKEKSKSLNKLKSEIVRLEKKIGADNSYYMNVLKRKKDIQNLVRKSNQEANENIKNLEMESAIAKKDLAHLVVLRLSPLKSPKELLGNKMLMISLGKKIQKLKKSLKKESENKILIKKLYNDYKELSEIEGHIVSTLRELEIKKQNYAQKYMEGLKSKSKLENLKRKEFQKKKIQRLAKKKSIKKSKQPSVQFRFSNPIEEFISVEEGEKGVRYRYSGRTPIKAPLKGKVDYVGDLSPYGEVIMINHGDYTRSVILGSMRIMTRKGAKVSEGEILGYTDAKGSLGSLYFDVRKKSTVVNTARLLREAKSKKSIVSARN